MVCRLVRIYVAHTTRVGRAGSFKTSTSFRIYCSEVSAYVSCVAILSAICAVTFGSICSRPLDLVHRALCGITFGSVGTGLRVSNAGFLRMPYFSTENAVPTLFCYVTSLGAKPFLLSCIQGFQLIYLFGADELCAPLILLSLMTSVS